MDVYSCNNFFAKKRNVGLIVVKQNMFIQRPVLKHLLERAGREILGLSLFYSINSEASYRHMLRSQLAKEN